MLRYLSLFSGLVLPSLALPASPLSADLPPATRWMPQDTIAVVEISRPAAILEALLDPRLARAVTSFPAFRKQASTPGFRQFLAVVLHLEERLGTDWRRGVRKLLGGGVTLAIGRDGGALLAVDSEDGKLLEELHEIILEFARGQAAGKGQTDRVRSREYRGVTGWSIGVREAHAIVAKRFLLASGPAVLGAALDRRATPDAGSLASLSAFRAAKEAAGSDAVASVFINLKALREHPPVQRALAGSRNPLAALLLAGITEALRDSSWLVAGVKVNGDTLGLTATVDGEKLDPEGPEKFASPDRPGEGILPNLSVPRRIAGLSFFRDLRGFYAAKDDLFPERTSGLIFFENMMGIFFSGLDLTEEVLAETRPEIRLVVAEQEYDPSIGTPRIQMPAFAAILRLRNPEAFGEVVEEAWQKALGLINFTRGQQALPGLIIDRETHGSTRFTLAYFRPAGDEGRTDLDSRYNVRPALARVGDTLILSSTDGLARDLIDLFEGGGDRTAPAKETHSLVEIDGVQLLSILRANRDNLIRQNMLEKGHTREEGETEVDLLLHVLRFLGRAKLSAGRHHERPQATLELKLKWPRRRVQTVLHGGKGPIDGAFDAGGGSRHAR